MNLEVKINKIRNIKQAELELPFEKGLYNADNVSNGKNIFCSYAN